jgi:hypothetical protein
MLFLLTSLDAPEILLPLRKEALELERLLLDVILIRELLDRPRKKRALCSMGIHTYQSTLTITKYTTNLPTSSSVSVIIYILLQLKCDRSVAATGLEVRVEGFHSYSIIAIKAMSRFSAPDKKIWVPI